MITDGRYFFRGHSAETLWRYDSRWRRIKYFNPRTEPFEVVEGDGALLLLSGHSGAAMATVHAIGDPDTAVATATFDGTAWAFEGDTKAWALVPEWVLLPHEGKRALVQIGDHAEIDELTDVPEPSTVIAVPESRLIVLAGSGTVTVYDPASQHAGVRLELSQKNPHPTLRFRNADSELWVDDHDTLLRLETRDWTVVDAAGSAAEDDSESPRITAWTFSPDLTRVLIVREGEDNVVIADAETLEPIATFLTSHPPVDVAEGDDGKLIAVDSEGKLPKAKLLA